MYSDFTNIKNNVTDLKALNNSIRNILLTRRGSVPGNPRFGSDLHQLIFSQLDTLTEAVAKNMILEALQEFEDRISIKSVNIVSVPEYNRLSCEIVFDYRDELNTKLESSTTVSFNQ